MKEFTYCITDPQGIHARPAGLLVKIASAYNSKITIGKDGRDVDLKKILGVMSLGCKKDHEIRITVEGEDEDQAAQGILDFLKENM